MLFWQGIQREYPSHFAPSQLVEGCLEVIQDDGVCQALEYEGEFPEWVDGADGEDGRYGEDIDDDKDDADNH